MPDQAPIARAPATMLDRLGAAYRGLLTLVAVALLGLIVSVMGAQVFARYVLNASMIWAEELCRYLLVWIAFLFSGLAYTRGELASVQVFTARMGERPALVFASAMRILVIAFLVVLAHYGWRFAQFNANLSIPAAGFIATDVFGAARPAQVSMAFVHAAVPVGSLLLAAHVALALAVDLVRLRARSGER